MNIYKNKYIKYKLKYLTLKGSGSIDDTTEGPIDIRELDEKYVLPIKFDGRETSIDAIDVGIYGKARAIQVSRYKFDDDDFINKLVKNTTKILLIDHVDTFDEFTDKYGKKVTDHYIIEWDKVQEDYKGIYLAPTLYDDRFSYTKEGDISWWDYEYFYDGVLIFVEPEYERFKGVVKDYPFKSRVFSQMYFREDHYINFEDGPNRDKIVKLEDTMSFDKFTNKYGELYDKDKNDIYTLKIKWNDVKGDFKGFLIDKDSYEPLFIKRAYKTFYKDNKYFSWWKGEGIQSGVVYIFE